MSPTQDEGGFRSTSAKPPSAGGLHAHPQEVVLLASGWPSPPLRARELRVSTPPDILVGGVPIPWFRVDIPILRFSHAAALLVLQGLPPQRLFPPDAQFSACSAAPFGLAGPLVLLRALYAPAYDPSPHMRDVVLAKLAPEHVQADVLQQLVVAIQAA